MRVGQSDSSVGSGVWSCSLIAALSAATRLFQCCHLHASGVKENPPGSTQLEDLFDARVGEAFGPLLLHGWVARYWDPRGRDDSHSVGVSPPTANHRRGTIPADLLPVSASPIHSSPGRQGGGGVRSGSRCRSGRPVWARYSDQGGVIRTPLVCPHQRQTTQGTSQQISRPSPPPPSTSPIPGKRVGEAYVRPTSTASHRMARSRVFLMPGWRARGDTSQALLP